MLYSLNNINASSPYYVIEYDDRSVYFKTDCGAGYLVSFIKDENLGISSTYQVVVTNEADSVFSGPDPKIGQTVASILKSFFENKIMCFCISAILRTGMRQPETENFADGSTVMPIRIAWR